MDNFYLHADDATIIRGQEFDEDQAILYSCDGDRIHNFPAEWTDEMIMRALRFANKAYDIGHRSGETAKAIEIKRALSIT